MKSKLFRLNLLIREQPPSQSKVWMRELLVVQWTIKRASHEPSWWAARKRLKQRRLRFWRKIYIAISQAWFCEGLKEGKNRISTTAFKPVAMVVSIQLSPPWSSELLHFYVQCTVIKANVRTNQPSTSNSPSPTTQTQKSITKTQLSSTPRAWTAIGIATCWSYCRIIWVRKLPFLELMLPSFTAGLWRLWRRGGWRILK